MGFLSGLFGGVANSLVGGLIGSKFGANSAQKQADLQRENWEYMQKNAHQFEVEDLRNAGLNPILSATNSRLAGMGAAPSMTDFGAGSQVSQSVTSALERQLQRDLKAADMDIENKKLQNDNLRIQNEKDKLELDRKLGESQINLNDVQAQSTSALATAQVRQIEQDIVNSIEEVKAKVNMYGAQSEAARAAASEALTRIGHIISQKTGQELTNEQLLRSLNDPQSKLHRELWEQGSDGLNVLGWSYYLGELFRAASPFTSASTKVGNVIVGARKGG